MLFFIMEFALKLNQPLAAGVNGKSAEIGHDPAPSQTLGHRTGRPTAAEKVRDKIVFITAGSNNTFEQSFRLLSREVRAVLLQRD